MVLRGHEKPITTLAFSPDGRTLATAAWGLEVRLWEVASGLPRMTTTAAQGPIDPLSPRIITDLAFSPDGRLFAIATCDGVTNRVELWDLPTQRHLHTLKGTGREMFAIAFSPDGTILATGGRDRFVTLWRPTTAKRIATLVHEDGKTTYPLAFAKDGKHLAVATSGVESGKIYLWDTYERKVRATSKRTISVSHLALFSDSMTIAGADLCGPLHLFDLLRGTSQETALRQWTHVSIAHHANLLAASSGDQPIQFWSFNPVRPQGILSGSAGFAVLLCLSPQGQTLAIVRHRRAQIHQVELWKVPPLEKERRR
jgi:WD40 repeat protein